MTRTRLRTERNVYFSYHMIGVVEAHMLCGFTSNAEIAEVLQGEFDPRITATDVARWRAQYKAFDKAVRSAIHSLAAAAMTNIATAIRDGSVADSWRYLERTTQRFKPSQKMEHSGRIDTLEGTLARRASSNGHVPFSDDALRDEGVLIDDDGSQDSYDS